jgi:hypothetical protein
MIISVKSHHRVTKYLCKILCLFVKKLCKTIIYTGIKSGPLRSPSQLRVKRVLLEGAGVIEHRW